MIQIRDVRTYVAQSGAGDYHVQQGHWIVDSLSASLMSEYSAYRDSSASWDINVVGGLVVEIEPDVGHRNIDISTIGKPGCFIVGYHPHRFLIGQDPQNVELDRERFHLHRPYPVGERKGRQ